MAEIEDKDRKLPSPKMSYTEGYITLPVTEEQFRDFIKSLLGRPETLQKRIKGYFELSREDIINFHFLLEQRIQQQNDAKLVQFQGKIFFDDDSAVTLNSIETFGTYNQIRPLIATGVELNWVYLIKFQDKSVPERQEIQLQIIAENQIPKSKLRRESTIFSSPVLREELEIETLSYFDISIRYTARTWGEDILSLLSEHISTLLMRNESLSDILSLNRQRLEWISTALFTLIFFVGIYSWFALHPSIDFPATIESMIKNGATLDEKINFLLSNMDIAIMQSQGGDWRVWLVYILGFLTALGISGGLGVLVQRNYMSFVLLTRETEKAKSEYEKSQRRSWRIFVGSVLFSLITGIAGNIIVLFFSK